MYNEKSHWGGKNYFKILSNLTCMPWPTSKLLWQESLEERGLWSAPTLVSSSFLDLSVLFLHPLVLEYGREVRGKGSHALLGVSASGSSYLPNSGRHPVLWVAGIRLLVLIFLEVLLRQHPDCTFPLHKRSPYGSIPLTTTSLFSISVSISFFLFIYSLVCCNF